MGVKATVCEVPTDTPELSYPCLREGKIMKGLVVLFSDRTEGVVVVGTNTFPVGYYAKGWTYADKWLPFDGKVVLQNA